MFLSLFQWVIFVLVSLQLAKWKEKWSGKMSIRWKPEASSWFRLLKAGKIPFKQFVGIHYETFDLYALFGGKMTSGYVMRSGLLEIIFI